MTIASALAFPFLIVERNDKGKEKAVEIAIKEGKFYKSNLENYIFSKK